jgi:hypothetical protein
MDDRSPIARRAILSERSNGKYTDQPTGIDAETRPQRARQTFVELGIRARLHWIGRTGSQGKQIREREFTLLSSTRCC